MPWSERVVDEIIFSEPNLSTALLFCQDELDGELFDRFYDANQRPRTVENFILPLGHLLVVNSGLDVLGVRRHSQNSSIFEVESMRHLGPPKSYPNSVINSHLLKDINNLDSKNNYPDKCIIEMSDGYRGVLLFPSLVGPGIYPFPSVDLLLPDIARKRLKDLCGVMEPSYVDGEPGIRITMPLERKKSRFIGNLSGVMARIVPIP